MAVQCSCRAMRCLAAVATLSIGAGVATLASDMLTEGVDNARTGWVRDEKVFTPSNVARTTLLWKVKLESTPRAMHNLFAPLVAERVTTAQGPRELAVVAGVSDDLFGIAVGGRRRESSLEPHRPPERHGDDPPAVRRGPWIGWVSQPVR
jgi:hypothetical protein